mmetsp:Transcript_18687/g.43429  ORF Transcript_18687/g.43429 Transcript_18687/m.43429 type:complete len:457 (-) Transcript_18687:239-1609(-)
MLRLVKVGGRQACNASTASGFKAACSRGLKGIAARAAILPAEGTIEQAARAIQMQKLGRDVVRMELGDPDFGTPQHIADAAVEAMRAGKTHYEAAGGSPAMRQAVASYLDRTRPGLNADPENVLVTPGGKPIIFHSIAVLCEPGDEVIYPDPGFPAYEACIKWTGATPVPLKLQEETGFRFSHEELRRLVSPKTKLIIVCSPGNPTGGVLQKEDLDVVAEVAKETGAWVLSDEIYSQLIFQGSLDSVALRPGMKERTIVLDGCSKAHAMTGWRVGFGLYPPELVGPARNLAIASWTCIPPFVAAGAIAALEGPSAATDGMRRELQARRDLLFDRLNAVPGINVAVRPAGAMYLLANITGTGLTSKQFASQLLDEEGVSVLDAEIFGAQGAGLVRISFAEPQHRLLEGCKRIEAFAARLQERSAGMHAGHDHVHVKSPLPFAPSLERGPVLQQGMAA